MSITLSLKTAVASRGNKFIDHPGYNKASPKSAKLVQVAPAPDGGRKQADPRALRANENRELTTYCEMKGITDKVSAGPKPNHLPCTPLH